MQDKNPTRKDIRLTGFDYSNAATYFITVCAFSRKNIFWKNAQTYQLSEIGIIAEKAIKDIPQHYELVQVDKYVVMPDHIHLLLTILTDANDLTKKRPNVSEVVKQYKSAVTKAAEIGPIWQARFFDRVIRNEKEFSEAWDYIDYNPTKYLASCRDD